MKQTKAERFLEEFNDIDERFLKEAMNYTMKKKFNFKPIIAAAACAVFALAAIPVAQHFATPPAVQSTQGTQTQPTSGFTVYEVEAMDEAPGLGTHNIDSPFTKRNPKIKDDTKTGEQRIFIFEGNEIIATYRESFAASDYVGLRDKYCGYVDGKEIMFKVDTETGKCDEFMLFRGESVDDTVLTRDQLYEIAFDFFKDGGYVDDIENYKLAYEINNGETVGCKFKFARFIDGIETADYIMIGVSWNGEVYLMTSNDLGELKDCDVSSIDMGALYDEIEKRLKTIYGERYIGFERNGAVFTKLTNGSYVFDYIPEVQVKYFTGGTVTVGCYLVATMD